jgi:hypothetical protein
VAFDYNEPILGRRRTGVDGDEFVLTTNSYQVTPNSIIVLGEVPNRLARVTVHDMTEVTEIPDTGLSPTTFFVDYNQGYVHVHASLIGTNKVCTFYGSGAYYINVARIFTNSVNGEITQTLDSIVEAASNFVFLNDYNNATIYKQYNIVNYQGASFMYINISSASGHLPNDPFYWSRVSGGIFRGTYNIATNYNSGDTICDSNNYKMYQSLISNNLNQALTDTSKWQLLIDVSGIVTTLTSTNSSVTAAESSRATAESNRVTAESGRVGAESSRVSAESTRSGNETTRQNNETTRSTNETARIGRDTAFQLLEAYNNTHSYAPLNKVTLGGNTYQCILATTGNTPPNATYWTLIAAKGADGAGTVAGITSTNTDIAVGGTPQNPTLTANTGTGANQIVKRNTSGFIDNVVNLTTIANDVLITSTSIQTIATYTPTAKNNFMIMVYFRVVTSTTNVTIAVTYTDGTGTQTNTLLNAQSSAVGSYSLIPLFINATASAINVNVTASIANQVYASASIVGV